MSHLADRILGLHGWGALLVIFAVPALESSAFLGFLFPGEVAVLLGGVLAYQHKVSLPAAIAAAVAGAVIGDTIGFEVGKRWGRAILHGTVGRVVNKDHLERAERYLAERGGKAVFFGRFTAALRVLIPGMAGMSGMCAPTAATATSDGTSTNSTTKKRVANPGDGVALLRLKLSCICEAIDTLVPYLINISDLPRPLTRKGPRLLGFGQ
ncbi:MAG: hypothetical protein NVS3B12_09710 [Acidimicrobiales bacterium]